MEMMQLIYIVGIIIGGTFSLYSISINSPQNLQKWPIWKRWLHVVAPLFWPIVVGWVLVEIFLAICSGIYYTIRWLFGK